MVFKRLRSCAFDGSSLSIERVTDLKLNIDGQIFSQSYLKQTLSEPKKRHSGDSLLNWVISGNYSTLGQSCKTIYALRMQMSKYKYITIGMHINIIIRCLTKWFKVKISLPYNNNNNNYNNNNNNNNNNNINSNNNNNNNNNLYFTRVTKSYTGFDFCCGPRI